VNSWISLQNVHEKRKKLPDEIYQFRSELISEHGWQSLRQWGLKGENRRCDVSATGGYKFDLRHSDLHAAQFKIIFLSAKTGEASCFACIDENT